MYLSPELADYHLKINIEYGAHRHERKTRCGEIRYQRFFKTEDDMSTSPRQIF